MQNQSKGDFDMNRPNSRRQLLLASAACIVAPTVASQTAWPTEKPIRLIVPFAPGGSTDGIARALADEMGKRLGQSIIVDNRAGAGSTLGTGQVAKAAPDGYTLLVSVISASSIGSTLYRGRLDWDPNTSFAHIADILRTPYVMLANKSTPYNNMTELIAAAKAKPGINYGTSGIGSIPHLVMLRLAQSLGVEFTHIPYRGGAPAVTDAIGGQLPLVLDGLAAAVPHLKSGALKGLGVTSAKRSAVLPDLPTFIEQGLKDNVVEGWAGLAAPAGTPRPILERLANTAKEVMAMPHIQERYKSASSAGGSLFLDDMQRFVKADADLWRPLVIASGAKVE
jgi:tripartite-type tricarboxylate transporter receptor subunit TctC